MTTSYDANIPYDSVLNYNGGQPLVTPEILPTLALRARTMVGVVGPLPQANIEQVSFEDSSPSAVGFKIPKGSIGSELLEEYTIVEMTMNGELVRDGRWLLRGKAWNAGKRGQVLGWTGRSLLWDRLEHTIVQPGRRYLYGAKSPGFILNDLFTEAKSRGVGYWSNFTWTFSSQFDSNGQAWPQVLGSIEYLPTAKYNDIVANMVDRGLIEIHLDGDEIVVFVANSIGMNTDAILVLGPDLSDAPQQSSADNIISDVLVLGDEGTVVARSNLDTRSNYWREEAGISQGGTKDIGTLSLFGDVALSGGDSPRVQRTYELVITHERPFLPVRDYTVGDWLRVQHSDESLMSLRVKQLVLKQDTNRKWTGTLVLNDKFLENELRLTKKVDGIIGGATITGSSQTSTPDDLKDTGVPNAITGMGFAANTYQNNDGVTRAILTVSWDPVTHNTDGTVATDMGLYRVVWWYNDLGFGTRQIVDVDHPQTTVSMSDLDTGREVSVYIYSKDNSGNISALIPSQSIVLASDTTPPSQPSGPLLATILRIMIVEYNGLSQAGFPMEVDFDHVEVWSSTVNNFDPDSEGDYHGKLFGAGQLYVPMYSVSPGTTVYIKFIAVDKSGNRSIPSGQNWAAVQGVVGSDMVANTITANQIAAGAITAQKISAGAITADKISVGQTQNLVPDPSFNNVDWRVRRLTTEWADRPEKWFFRDDPGTLSRNGYWLQALSTPVGENGGRMYITDWLSTMLGESYYVAMYMITGTGLPNPEATMTLGVEVTYSDGTVQSDGVDYLPMAGIWTKHGYRFLIQDQNWVKVRFFLRANNLNAGDIGIDDVEVRGGVGTTATANSRGLLDALGLFAWDDDENQTFILDFRTGDLTARGTIKSGFVGKRVEINPGTTYLPEIRFYPDSGELFAYINASGTSTFPFIGVNSPDTGGASMTMVLFDTDWDIGEITKSTGQVGGPAISGVGSGHGGYLHFSGKMGGGSNALDLFSSYRYLVGTGSGVVAVSIPITKGPAPLNGFNLPIYSLARPGTGQKAFHQISATSTTSWTLLINSGDANNLTNVTNHIHVLYVRSDSA